MDDGAEQDVIFAQADGGNFRRKLERNGPSEFLAGHHRRPIFEQIIEREIFLVEVTLGDVGHGKRRQGLRAQLFPIRLGLPHPIGRMAQTQPQLRLVERFGQDGRTGQLVAFERIFFQFQRFAVESDKERLDELRFLAFDIIPQIHGLLVVAVVGEIPEHHPTKMVREGRCGAAAARHGATVHPVDQRGVRTIAMRVDGRGRSHLPTPDHCSGRTVARRGAVLGSRLFLGQPHEIEGTVRTDSRVVVPHVSGEAVLQQRAAGGIAQIDPRVEIEKSATPDPSVGHALELDAVPSLVVEGGAVVHEIAEPSTLQGQIFHSNLLEHRDRRDFHPEVSAQIDQDRFLQDEHVVTHLLDPVDLVHARAVLNEPLPSGMQFQTGKQFVVELVGLAFQDNPLVRLEALGGFDRNLETVPIHRARHGYRRRTIRLPGRRFEHENVGDLGPVIFALGIFRSFRDRIRARAVAGVDRTDNRAARGGTRSTDDDARLTDADRFCLVAVAPDEKFSRGKQNHTAAGRLGCGNRLADGVLVAKLIVGHRAVIGHLENRTGDIRDRFFPVLVSGVGKIGQNIRGRTVFRLLESQPVSGLLGLGEGVRGQGDRKQKRAG